MDWPNIEDTKKNSVNREGNTTKTFRQDSIWYSQFKRCAVDYIQIKPSQASNHNCSPYRTRRSQGCSGHNGNCEGIFFWQKMDDDIKSFVQTCLHCLCTQPGTTIRRPLGHALHADLPNELLHFDFCYTSPAEDYSHYVQNLKDDHSGYVWIAPRTETTAEITADLLIKWFSAFGVVTQWVSDRGSHFKNEVVRLLQEKTKSSHHFTLAYCARSNGTFEVVCRELLRACRALLSEYQLPQTCWPSIMPVVQSALNNSLLDRLGNRCPLTVFTEHKQDILLATVTRTMARKTQVLSIDDIRLAQLLRDCKRLRGNLSLVPWLRQWFDDL